MRATDKAVESALSYHQVGEQGVPVFRSSIGSNYHGAAAIALVDKLIQVFGLGLGKFLKGEIVNDKQIRLQVAAQPLLPGIIGSTASRIRQQPIGLDKQDSVAEATWLMS